MHYFRYSKVRMLASIMSYETPKVVTVHNPSIGLLRQCSQQLETHCIFLWGTCWCESLMWICNNGWRFLSNGTDRERDRHMVSIITNLQCLTSRCSSISIQPMIVIIVPLPWLCAGRRVLQVLVVLYVAVSQLWYAQEGITSIHILFNV